MEEHDDAGRLAGLPRLSFYGRASPVESHPLKIRQHSHRAINEHRKKIKTEFIESIIDCIQSG